MPNWKIEKWHEQHQVEEQYAETLSEAKARGRNMVMLYDEANWIDKSPEFQIYVQHPTTLVLEGYEDKFDELLKITYLDT